MVDQEPSGRTTRRRQGSLKKIALWEQSPAKRGKKKVGAYKGRRGNVLPRAGVGHRSEEKREKGNF